MGAQRVRSFREAATKFLQENTHKRSLERDARALAGLDPYIGALPLRRVHHETVQTYVRARLQAGISPGTVNRDLAVVRRILNLSARLWRDQSDRPWLTTAPLIQMQASSAQASALPLVDGRGATAVLGARWSPRHDGALQGEHRVSRTGSRQFTL